MMGISDDSENSGKNKINWKLLFSIIGQIVGGIGQGIFLPVFISTLTHSSSGSTGAYFVYFMMSTLFNIPFGIGCVIDWYRGKLTYAMMKKHFGILILMGVCDALNGLMVVFTSALGRTSGDLQSILIQSTIPFTILFSRIIAKIKITKKEIFCAGIVMFGIILSIIPNLLNLVNGQTGAKLWFYPLIFSLATIPGVIMNVVQHKVFDVDRHYNKNWMLLIESFFQLLTATSLFWVDFTIPYIKTANNINEFSDNFQFGFKCFFNPYSVGGRCEYSWIFGLLFALSYCTTYWTGSYIIQHASANFSAIVSTIITPIQITIWYSWPALTIWAGGEKYSNINVIFGIISVILFVIPGSFYYKKYENMRKKSEERDIL